MRNGKYNGTDKQTDYSKSEKAPDNPGDDQGKWYISAPLDKERPEEIVDESAKDRPQQKPGTPEGAVFRINPNDYAYKQRDRTDLHNCQDESHGGQQCSERNTDESQPDPYQDRLHNSGNYDPKCDTANCLGREQRRLLAARARKAPREESATLRRGLGVGIQDRENDYGQKKLEEQ
jgi:hypothetical protein